LLPADCAGMPCPLFGGPVDVFGDHTVSCKKSGFGDRHLGTQTFFCQVLTQSQVPHDREVDIAGNGRRPADILLKAWDGRRDLAVHLTIVHPKPVTGRPLRGSAAIFLKDKRERKCKETAGSCGRMGVDFSPMVFDTWGGLHSSGKELVKAMFTRCTAPLLPSARPAAVGTLRQGLSVPLGRSVAQQLEAPMMVTTETRHGGQRLSRPPQPSLRRVTRSGEPWARGSPPRAHCVGTVRTEMLHTNTTLPLVLKFFRVLT